MKVALTVILLSYLTGSVSFALLISRAHGIDLRKRGSGNLGATNVLRSIGPAWGRLCFALDFLKGLVPVLLVRLLASSGTAELLVVLAAAAVIAGHVWPVFLRFKGGKGVATSLGALLAVAPLPVIAALLCWIGAFYATRYVSVASLAAALAFPVSALLLNLLLPWKTRGPALFILTLVAALIVVKHWPNIRRLWNGDEHRFIKEKR